MAGSVNKVILIGHLGKDPTVRRTQDGRPIVSFSIATSNSWRDKDSGERKERTQWHNIVVFNKQAAEFGEKFLKKGMKVYVEGELETRDYMDSRDNIKRWITEVILRSFNCVLQSLEKIEGGGGGARPPDNDDVDGRGGARESVPPRGGGRNDMDDEIPF